MNADEDTLLRPHGQLYEELGEVTIDQRLYQVISINILLINALVLYLQYFLCFYYNIHVLKSLYTL